MKTIFILRHAKSDSDNPKLNDFERPLNERGVEAAGRIGAYFKSKKYSCDIVLCSSAQRTRETFGLIKPYLHDGMSLKLDDLLYLAEPKYLVRCLRALSDDVQSAMIIGHNPGLEQLAHSLVAKARGAEASALQRSLEDGFPTCALAVVRSAAETWAGLKPGRCELLDFVRPRDLLPRNGDVNVE